jgi:phosphatidylglycerol:prolipoprotein diacylglycerol transferase
VSERQRFLENPLMIFKIWEGGLVFFGGLIAGMIVGIWYVRRHKMPVLLMCDVFAPAIAIGHAIGRVGCFLAGCCYGRVVDHPAWYSIIFPTNPRSFAPTGIALYPTQLMEVVGELVIFSILIVQRRFKRFDGQIMATYLILYSILRSFNEYYRGDADRGFVIEPWLSTSQFVSIILFIAGLTLYFKFWRKGGQKV